MAGLAGPVFTATIAAAAGVDDESFFTHLHTERAMANVTVTPGRAGPVEIAVQLETVDEMPLPAVAVSVILSGPEAGGGTIKAPAVHTVDDQWRATVTLPSSGRWSMGLEIKLSENDEVKIASPILIR
ncbi:hypothetical protein MTR72_24650 [Bradyrhizobium sp. ISRA442]|uniref:hypothetical protein n=1 Tax=Bradyrhizobium sp. ISRA442 TaxID=2866197 RepID=UPI00311ACDB4